MKMGSIEETWKVAFNATGSPGAADLAVFEAFPDLDHFTRLGRPGKDGPEDDSWVGKPITVVNMSKLMDPMGLPVWPPSSAT
jgi:hypothetical protein